MTTSTLNEAQLKELATDYINAWSTSNSETRKELVARVYADNAEFFSAEDGNLRLQGHPAIGDNIGHVNERDIQGNGLTINHTGTFLNHGVAKVTWEMLTPNGAAALAGMDVLMLDDNGKIAKDYIFIG